MHARITRLVLSWLIPHCQMLCRAPDGMVLSLAVPFAGGKLLTGCVMDEVNNRAYVNSMSNTALSTCASAGYSDWCNLSLPLESWL